MMFELIKLAGAAVLAALSLYAAAHGLAGGFSPATPRVPVEGLAAAFTAPPMDTASYPARCRATDAAVVPGARRVSATRWRTDTGTVTLAAGRITNNTLRTVTVTLACAHNR